VVRRCSKPYATQPKSNIEKKREYGRGNRVRKLVNYCDEENDDQQPKVGEEESEQEDESSLIAVPKKRRKARQAAASNDKSEPNDEGSD
jgi:hypothetical protein